VIIGSYVPDCPYVLRWVESHRRGILGFYDIDTPVTLRKLAEGDGEYLEPWMIPCLDLYLSFTGGPTLRLLEQRYGARQARALYCSVDADAYAPTGARRRWDLGYLGTYSPDRQPALETLLLEPARLRQERRFVVAGPQYPAEIDWPPNVERIEHLPPAEHADFYSSLGWTLNVTRADMVRAGYSPSVRLFEATACGTPVISDIWPGIETILASDRELKLVAETRDVLAALDLPEAQRSAIGQAGRTRTLQAHTADRRAEELEMYLRALVRVPVGA
jgi:spore maturation protein CgeB